MARKLDPNSHRSADAATTPAITAALVNRRAPTGNRRRRCTIATRTIAANNGSRIELIWLTSSPIDYELNVGIGQRSHAHGSDVRGVQPKRTGNRLSTRKAACPERNRPDQWGSSRPQRTTGYLSTT